MEHVKPKNEFYSGFLYAKVFDPVMTRTREMILNQVPTESRVVDIACGTGHQLITMAPHIKRGVGIDLSDTMVQYAEKQRTKMEIDSISFQVGNATNLPQFGDKSFDIALVTLLLHELPVEQRIPVLKEMKRLAHTIIVADWGESDLLRKFIVGSIELSVGLLHAHHYISFKRMGGIQPLLEMANLEIKKELTAVKETITICICE